MKLISKLRDHTICYAKETECEKAVNCGVKNWFGNFIPDNATVIKRKIPANTY